MQDFCILKKNIIQFVQQKYILFFNFNFMSTCSSQKSCLDCNLHEELKKWKPDIGMIHNVIVTWEIESCRNLATEILLEDLSNRKNS